MKSLRAGVLTACALLLCAAGCGKKDERNVRLEELQERNRLLAAKIGKEREAQRREYMRKIRGYEAEIRALEDRLEREKKENAVPRRAAPAPAAKAGESGAAKKRIAAAGGETGPSGEPANTPAPGGGEEDGALDLFIREYGAMMDEGQRARFSRDFEAYALSHGTDSAARPLSARKEAILGGLKERIAEAEDEAEREALESRREKIESASDEDLAGVIDYYERLDGFDDLNGLMEEYGIPRDALRDYGVEPPPRYRWGPDVREIAYNLEDFVADYEPLTDPGMREQYRDDFNSIINEMNRTPTNKELLAERDRMLADIEERLATASESEKRWLERRKRRIEESELSYVRRRVQMETLRGIDALAGRYGIPRQELRQSGVLVPRWGRRR